MDGKVPAKAEQEKSLGGALKMVERIDDKSGENVERINQTGYGDWPVCSLCRPARQIEPTKWSNHQNAHIAKVDD